MSDEYRALLVDAYKGELLGDALFGAFAARETGEHSEKSRALQHIEATTAAQLQTLVLDAGAVVTADDEATARAQGTEIGAAGIPWDAFMKGLHDGLPPYLASFVRLRSIAPDPNDAALVALVNHEQAINAFAELELAGNADISLAVLQWHLDSVT